jgi:hypothetical protein
VLVGVLGLPLAPRAASARRLANGPPPPPYPGAAGNSAKVGLLGLEYEDVPRRAEDVNQIATLQEQVRTLEQQLLSAKNSFSQLVSSVSAELSKISSGGSLTTADPHLNVSVTADLVFMVSPLDTVLDGEIALNSQQRKCGQFTLSQVLDVKVFVPTAAVALTSLTIQVDLFVKEHPEYCHAEAVDKYMVLRRR